MPMRAYIQHAGGDTSVKHFKNSITFRQDPVEGITIRFWAKKPGLEMEMEARVFNVDFARAAKIAVHGRI